LYPAVTYHLPEWIADEIGDPGRRYPTLEARMDLAIRLSARNIAEGSGPFVGERNRVFRKKPGFSSAEPRFVEKIRLQPKLMSQSSISAQLRVVQAVSLQLCVV